MNLSENSITNNYCIELELACNRVREPNLDSGRLVGNSLAADTSRCGLNPDTAFTADAIRLVPPR
jgi:hypothetical protein